MARKSESRAPSGGFGGLRGASEDLIAGVVGDDGAAVVREAANGSGRIRGFPGLASKRRVYVSAAEEWEED